MEKEKVDICLKDGRYSVQFDANKTIEKLTIILEKKYSGELTVQYAQNNVVSDLIDLGQKKVVDGESEIEIKLNRPIIASAIYVTLLDPYVKVLKISICEKKSNNIHNCYPQCKDLDLGQNYYLDKILVFTKTEGYCHYSVYTSMNGRDFEFVAEKKSNENCDFENGDIFEVYGKEARFIRIYLEYNSASPEACVREIKFKGVRSETELIKYPELEISEFYNSEYDVEITDADTYNEVYGIISRRLGSNYESWFTLELAKNPKEGHFFDYFEISEKDCKINIMANNGVSLATGLNYYLKYYCNVNISQVGEQVKMPEEPVKINKIIFKETCAKIRYAYNYCTHSYSMAFWGTKEWRDELDWLALNGVNLVLDITAQEEVWRRFLSKIGYSHDEIKKHITGPGYYAWAYMANMYGFGGPVHDSWFKNRTELARQNHLIMRKLGMYPVLQGYSGMVPIDIDKYDKDVDVIPQGTWCSFVRPYMIRTTSQSFKKYAMTFYQAQEDVYGKYSHYYATDPFHEGGITADLSLRDVSREVLNAMIDANFEAIWVIQSWQRNPTSEFLLGLADVKNGKEHALILDLYADKTPNYTDGHKNNPYHGYIDEFNQTPWVFCMLNNFGGRLGMHGHLDNLINWVPDAFNNSKKIKGIGITPEASFNNPVLYDFFFESIWQDEATEKMDSIDVDTWIRRYTERRYGSTSNKVQKAWNILLQTVYKAEYNNLGQGAPESVVNARPSFNINAASTWGNSIVGYNKDDLKEAAILLFDEYELLKASDGYKYDIITILQQVLSNMAQDTYKKMITSYDNKEVDVFIKYSKEFLEIADNMEYITSGNKYYLLGRWIEQANQLAEGTDDFTKKIYQFNAKALVTTWGAYNQSETGELHDYSNRQWSGLIGDFYKKRWERWINDRIIQQII